ncbi:hypothetical protein TSAR_007068 [Trichomalopsis sarcophagae]|uniref:Glucose-methanol-choline oxidoreductase N-terminal domain-containing protein n=1 Tax=Trichomalopsis sarcophagae TaxID=543379 RepID=A0A232FNN4_9HYME|nr:hypothetical protein TSAR_007068 [Trichomalopsis sarcophagae]
MGTYKMVSFIICLAITSSYAHRLYLGTSDSLRKNIADLFQGKLNFTDSSIPFNVEELEDITPEYDSEYDFIVIGAGSAGATIASRLSEEKKTNVLLIEAGGKEYPIMDIPRIAGALQLNAQINWMYETESSDKFCLGLTNSKCKWPRGKVMGGNSVFNYMLATRGNKRDFDGWAKSTGDASWSYKNMLTYLKKLENYRVEGIEVDDELHNKKGPLYISSAPYKTKLAEAFIEANEELGLPMNDYNGQEQMGVCYMQSNVKDGERWSANRAYLYPARFRKNLFLTRNSHVNKILIDENTKTAYGVQFTKGDKNIIVRAKKEVILSAGAINSPQILMLSGIGPAKHLGDLGIHVIRNAPVGENLMDHIAYGGLLFKVNDSATYTEENLLDPNDPTIETYITKRNGSLGIGTGFEALSYIDVDNEKLLSNEPNVELLFAGIKGMVDPILSIALGVSDEYRNRFLAENITQSVWTIWPMIMNPKSRGKLLLQSKDPNAKPKLYPNYLDHPDDIKILIGGIRAVIRLSKTKAFQRYGSEMHDVHLPCNKFQFDSDAYWECAIRTFPFTIYHQSGTCKMGRETDETAVVIGVKGLRVADASIMPKIVSAHPHIPIVAIGEKISEQIKQEWRLE